MSEFKMKLVITVDDRELETVEYKSNRISEVVAALLKYLKAMGPY
jgi:hypothetical protein